MKGDPPEPDEASVAGGHPPLAPVAVKIAVVTANRTTGAVIQAMLQGPGRAAEWIARDATDATSPCEAIARAEIAFIEIRTSEDVIALVTAACIGSADAPACVAMTPTGRSDLRSAAEAAGFQGWVGLPIEAEPLADVARAMCEGLGREWENAPGRDCAPSVIDRRALDDLAGLGGEGFVQDIVTQFIDDAASLLETLKAAMKAGDVSDFRDQAHALRSCAANVGARNVYSRCLDMRGIEARELAKSGDSYMRRLETDVQQARQALSSYVRGC